MLLVYVNVVISQHTVGCW